MGAMFRSVARFCARFSARFDNCLLQAPPFDAAASDDAVAAADTAALNASLLALCRGGARWASASHPLAAAPEQRAQQQLWLQQQLLALDGTLHMQSLGGPWRQRVHRLALKLRESGLTDGAAASPWDCGLLRATPEALQQAACFAPRRPTLMVGWQLPACAAQPFVDTLQTRQHTWGHPVRLWLLQAPPGGG